MKALKIILFSVIGIAVLLVAVGLFLPSSYSAERSIVINAPASVVFNQVNDVKNWEAWGPWQEDDPDMRVEYGEITEGVGASYNWFGKDGDGTLIIEESVEFSSIKTDLDFGDQGKAKGRWTFEEADEGVKVTWGIDGDAGGNIMMKYFGLVMDSMIGPYFERGLAKIKEICEAMPVPEPQEEELTQK